MSRLPAPAPDGDAPCGYAFDHREGPGVNGWNRKDDPLTLFLTADTQIDAVFRRLGSLLAPFDEVCGLCLLPTGLVTVAGLIGMKRRRRRTRRGARR